MEFWSSLLIGVAGGAVGGPVVGEIIRRCKVEDNTDKLKFHPEESIEPDGWKRIRIHNTSYQTLHRVVPYLRINRDKSDIIEPNNLANGNYRLEAFETSQNALKTMPYARSVWSTQFFRGGNHFEIDIRPDETVEVAICSIFSRNFIDSGQRIRLIGIPSELGCSSTRIGDYTPTSRVFLKGKTYSGELKLVSEDTLAKKVRFKIDFEDASRLNPIRFISCPKIIRSPSYHE